MKYANMFVFAFAVIALSSHATAQEKKAEPKDVTSEVKKMVEGSKLYLGGKASNRSVTLDDKMQIESATRNGKELVIVIKVTGPKQHVVFAGMDGVATATYDPDSKKGKEHAIGIKGRENFQFKGTLKVTIPDESALKKPAPAAPAAQPEPKGKGKGKVKAKKGKANNKA
jgi:hypothetical protein